MSNSCCPCAFSDSFPSWIRYWAYFLVLYSSPCWYVSSYLEDTILSSPWQLSKIYIDSRDHTSHLIPKLPHLIISNKLKVWWEFSFLIFRLQRTFYKINAKTWSNWSGAELHLILYMHSKMQLCWQLNTIDIIASKSYSLYGGNITYYRVIQKLFRNHNAGIVSSFITI